MTLVYLASPRKGLNAREACSSNNERLAERSKLSYSKPTRPPSYRTYTPTTVVDALLAVRDKLPAKTLPTAAAKLNGGEKMQPVGYRIAIEPLLLVHF